MFGQGWKSHSRFHNKDVDAQAPWMLLESLLQAGRQATINEMLEGGLPVCRDLFCPQHSSKCASSLLHKAVGTQASVACHIVGTFCRQV